MEGLSRSRITATRRTTRAGTFAAGILIGLSLVSSAALAKARPVGGDKATWDRVCQADKDCMPFGDVGGGRNGYFVHDGNGGGTAVWCDDNNCAAERQPMKPAKDAVQILEQPVLQMEGATGGKAATANQDPAALLDLR